MGFVARTSVFFSRSWSRSIGHFDALGDRGKQILQYGTSSADVVDGDRGIVDHELEGLSNFANNCEFSFNVTLRACLPSAA